MLYICASWWEPKAILKFTLSRPRTYSVASRTLWPSTACDDIAGALDIGVVAVAVAVDAATDDDDVAHRRRSRAFDILLFLGGRAKSDRIFCKRDRVDLAPWRARVQNCTQNSRSHMRGTRPLTDFAKAMARATAGNVCVLAPTTKKITSTPRWRHARTRDRVGDLMATEHLHPISRPRSFNVPIHAFRRRILCVAWVCVRACFAAVVVLW